MTNAMKLFTSIVIVQLFYSFVITGMAYSIPDDAKQYVTGFSDITDELSLESVGADIQEGVESQTSIPVIELGALIFYSGNILIDLLLNFAFAIPEMIGMLINGLMMLFSIDSVLFALVQLFATATITVVYLIGILQLIAGIRSGRVV